MSQAQVVMARPAQIALSAAEMKRHGHTVACSKVPYVASDLHHPAAEFVSWYSRQLQLDSEPGPMVLPHVPIASADTARFRLDDGIAWPGLRIGQVLNLQRVSESCDDCRSHFFLLIDNRSGLPHQCAERFGAIQHSRRQRGALARLDIHVHPKNRR